MPEVDASISYSIYNHHVMKNQSCIYSGSPAGAGFLPTGALEASVRYAGLQDVPELPICAQRKGLTVTGHVTD